jgi:ankyrin repeat protein
LYGIEHTIYSKAGELLFSTYPLFDAIRIDQSETVKYLLEAGADVDRGGLYGDSNLVKACDLKNKQIISYLLAAGACVNVVDRHGFIPLKHAIDDNDVDLVATLLAAGANPRLKANKNEPSALEYAYMKDNPQIIALLEASISKRPKKERRGCEIIPCTIS